MTTLPIVIRAVYRGNYRIRLAFNDGLEKTVDFREWLNRPVRVKDRALPEDVQRSLRRGPERQARLAASREKR